MLGINGGELLIIVLVAILVIGPERMPEYARQFREWIVRGRDMVNEGKESLKSEVGDDVDWKQLDPRQYDPRRIVKEALAEPPAASRSATAAASGTATTAAASSALSSAAVAEGAVSGGATSGGAASHGPPTGPAETAVAPFDDEAT
ncbi:twin-arginine translocase TatA/TatE family subunit [Demequina sediminicola]|uniref:twin-arginine translocase TatA/TatE family subunit n=1 Tax=Demequina sediminicola TaxID=1095026 RepID=UPI0009E20DBA|nr:twin-arginine translocase TatA/TatE family subunit [Demequina sediminicola]